MKIGYKHVEYLNKITAAAAAAAAAAKSLQSCPTLCDPTDSSHQAPPSLNSFSPLPLRIHVLLLISLPKCLKLFKVLGRMSDGVSLS